MNSESMSLKQQIGQLLMFGFQGYEVPPSLQSMIEKQELGGVIYFARNVQTVEQVARLSGQLQQLASEAGAPPLWISVDQEGGMVARLTEGVTLFPGQMALAATGDPQSAYDAGYITGSELKALGINFNFAPVLDVNNNPANPVIGVRSFGERPEQVARFGVSLIQGLQDAGIAATAKHFPGHGDTDTDSHLGLPTISHARERIESVELVPFRAAVAGGVDVIMSSHIVFPEYEPNGLPATLSRALLTDLLRHEIGYEGVIVTDCMEMDAIAKHFGTAEAAVMALEAGADLILVSHTLELQQAAFQAIVQAVETGRLSAERIRESVDRVLALKAKRLSPVAKEGGPASVLPIRQVGCAEYQQKARKWSEASITVVKDSQGLLPLAELSTLVLSLSPEVSTIADESYSSEEMTLGRALREQGLKVVEEQIRLADVSRLTAELEARAEGFPQVIVATYNACFDPAQAELVRSLLRKELKVIVVATRNPYDVQSIPELSTCLLTYETRPLAMASAARVMTGKLRANGRCPVTLEHGGNEGGER
ncbi:beta-N-acetylhexosaminidase [Paenibacillus senegalensis]|uniref:beta-N-acetylhexosaminidase n=1 Tax=Paenibacillus senegalensis TaxID=1465766 RepID=UPI0002DF49FD|nr:beta-N-acetylhexosaminidase [Paenibacillus senegalensis]